jgi:alpha/beta superfamily hydrolase
MEGEMNAGSTTTAFPSAAPGLRSVILVGPAGRLEALLNSGCPQPSAAALVCHPHPLGGGNLHNKVVYHAMKAMNDPDYGLGWPVLRYNFRGVGLSEGEFDGEAETGDVLAALDWLANEFHLPIVVAGYSFGAVMTLRACCAASPSRADLRALAAIGLPTRLADPAFDYSFLSTAAIPKLFLSGDRDEFAPADELRQVAAIASEPKRLVLLAGAGHFFSGQFTAVEQTISGWLKEQMP